MPLDAHQHFWRYEPRDYAWIDDSLAPLRRDVLPEESARTMASAGFDACLAVQARQTPAETPFLLALADANPCIAGVVGWTDLQAPDARVTLAALASHPKLVGMRHVVQSEPDDFLARPTFLAGVGLLGEFGLTYDVLIFERQFPAALEFVRRFPAQRFVLDHLGKPDIRHGRFQDWARQLRALAAEPNVACKLSGLVTEAHWHAWTPESLRPYIDEAADCFTPARLMIGSDWPVCTVAGSYAAVMDVVLDAIASWPASAQASVLGETARAWYVRSR